VTFIGRQSNLDVLADELDQVVEQRAGRFVLVRGRRRIGKSRLVEEFLRRASIPTLYFTASRQHRTAELGAFAEALARSDIPGADLFAASRADTWEAALTGVAALVGQSGPTALVIDEFPFLAEDDRDRLALEGTFQKVWDRTLQHLPIMLILIGSDLAMMRALTDYDRPLYGRPTRTVNVRPFSPLEVSELTGLEGRAALDAYAIVGGFPFVAASWRKGEAIARFLSRSFTDETSPLVVDGERILNAEFPATTQARQVLTTIGSGERTFTAISRTAGINHATLTRALDLLVKQKQVVASESPLSGRRQRDRHYYVADPYLRFWLRFVRPELPNIERGRGKEAARWTIERWPDYRGRAIEPIVRRSIEQMLPDDRLGDGFYAGSYWTRSGSVEIDLVITDKSSAPAEVRAVGSIKWRDRKRFDRRDADALIEASAAVPGVTAGTRTVGVSATGFAGDSGVDLEFGPEDLLRAWSRGD
jgi:uncharacterized protein